MPDSYKALAVPLEEDLLPLSVLLHQRGLPHRIIEDAGKQVLEVNSTTHVQEVNELYRAWRSGQLNIELSRRSRPVSDMTTEGAWHAAPATIALIALSIVGFLLVYIVQSPALISYFSFLPFEVRGGQLVFAEMGTQYWRLVTPIFLHFGWLHIAFNCLWMWELGHRVEEVMGHFNMLMLCMVVAVVSNVSQFVYGGASLFGGMSGVVYGLLGFAWVAPLLQPAWPIQPRTSVVLFMVGWLVFCLVGLVETLGFGSIANAAHVGGLLTGAALGVIFGFKSRLSDHSQ